MKATLLQGVNKTRCTCLATWLMLSFFPDQISLLSLISSLLTAKIAFHKTDSEERRERERERERRGGGV